MEVQRAVAGGVRAWARRGLAPDRPPRREGTALRRRTETQGNGCYACRAPDHATALGARRRRLKLHGEVRDRRRRAALGHDGHRPATRTARCRSSRPALLTDDEVLFATCRASATSRRCSRSSTRLGVDGRAGAATTSVALCAADVAATPRSTTSSPSRSAPRSCSPARCWRASAAPSMPPPGRRLHRPPPPRSPPRRLPRWAPRVDRAREIVLSAPPGLRAGDVFMDEPSVMATENALMAAALTPGTTRDRQRRLRAARPGPRPPARRRWAPTSTASAPT